MWSKLLIIIGLTHPLLHLTSAQGESCRTPDSKDGVCINIRNCKPLLSLLESRGVEVAQFLRNSLCRYDGSDPIVCCPQDTNSGKNDSANNKEIKNTPYGPLEPPHCGFSNVSHYRVVGGVESELGAWPWLAALGYRDLQNPSRTNWRCGGALISSRHVLTAAHCVFGFRNLLTTVRFGDLVLDDDNDGAKPIDVLIEKTTIHPRYESTSHTNDIAVIRLQEDVPFTLNVHPICLPTSDEMRSSTFERTYPFIAGWGSLEYNGTKSNKLMEVQLPVVSPETCKSAYKRFAAAFIDDRVMCAGFARGGKDACQGDSGGPLMLPRKNIYYLIGVVSFGYKCGLPNYPGVYTRVTEFLPFIVEQMV